MSDEVEVTERGEIVVHGCDGEAMVYQADGSWWLSAETYADGRRPAREGETRLTRDGLLEFCRRVLREVGPDPSPTLNEATIRADERAKVEAEVLARIQMRRTAYSEAIGDVQWWCGWREGLDDVEQDIRAGKHRSNQ